MKLITEKHTTEILFVQVPTISDKDVRRGKKGFMECEFEKAMRRCIDNCERVLLEDGITVGSECIEDLLENEELNAGLNTEVLKFLRAVIAVEPMPDEYFFHIK